jgi:carbon storage regulator
LLVLSRKEFECIFIGDIEIVVLKIKGEIVRIGIDAPKDVQILLGELKDKYGSDKR